MDRLARFISVIFHPLLMPTYLFIILSYALPSALDPIPPSSHTLFISLIFIVTFLLPVLNLGILKSMGFIRSFQLETRQERVFPFILVTLIYISISVLFYIKTRISVNDSFLRLLVIIDMLAAVGTIITFFFRISLHSLTAWGMIAILILLNKLTGAQSLFYPAVVTIFITGIVMSARLQLRSHTLKEVLLGGVAGLATGIAGMVMLFSEYGIL